MGAVRSDYAAILRDNTPVIDVRAPIEFERGALPNSFNVPILTDEERHRVGLAYKRDGDAAATALGYKLVSGTHKTDRVRAWARLVESQRDIALTCWRGGQRSQIAQQWLAVAGYDVPRLAGGFKSMRQYSLEVLARGGERDWLVLAGSTGVGKTRFLKQYEASIDLEAAANHRGSAFGQLTTPQPTPISFEIALAQILLQTANFASCLIEDESRTIGRLAIPAGLFDAMQSAPIVVLEASLEDRVEFTYSEYVRGADATRLTIALAHIQKRLGHTRYIALRGKLQEATRLNDAALHKDWIRCLLEWYYDPMYAYQLEKKSGRVVFRGNEEEVRAYLRDGNFIRREHGGA